MTRIPPGFHTESELATLDAEIVRLRDTGLSFGKIANQVGHSKPYVWRRFKARLAAVVDPAVDGYRTRQLAEIAAERELLTDILNAEHPLVSHGRRYDDLVDDAPVLAALDRLRQLRQQEQELVPGLKAVAKLELAGHVNYTVGGGVDPASLT